MAEQAAAAGLAARAAVLLESLAPSPSLPPNATSNGSDWGASQVQTDGSGSMNSSSPVVTGSSGGGGGGGTPGWQVSRCRHLHPRSLGTASWQPGACVPPACPLPQID